MSHLFVMSELSFYLLMASPLNWEIRRSVVNEDGAFSAMGDLGSVLFLPVVIVIFETAET